MSRIVRRHGRARLELKVGEPVLDAQAMRSNYIPLEPFDTNEALNKGSVAVERLTDHRIGVLDYQWDPRFYFNFHAPGSKAPPKKPAVKKKLVVVEHPWEAVA